jgi:hypothetical protein
MVRNGVTCQSMLYLDTVLTNNADSSPIGYNFSSRHSSVYCSMCDANFYGDTSHCNDNIPHFAESKGKVISTIAPQIVTTYNNVIDLFWIIINTNLFCNRDSLIKYLVPMGGTAYTVPTGEQVRALLEDLTSMVISSSAETFHHASPYRV